MNQAEQSNLEKLHGETALIPWVELQRFFAQGNVLHVSTSLDLVQTAVLFAEDAATRLAPHIDSNAIAQPSNQQARDWYENNIELWSVVVAPFVLVQEQSA
jgi:hypothetical protein